MGIHKWLSIAITVAAFLCYVAYEISISNDGGGSIGHRELAYKDNIVSSSIKSGTRANKYFIVNAPIRFATDIPAWTKHIEEAIADGSGDSNIGYTECASVIEIKGVYLCISDKLSTMGKALIRAELFIEAPFGLTPGNVVSIRSQEYLKALTQFAGLDLNGSDLLAFWSAAKAACSENSDYCGSDAERVFFTDFVLPISTMGKPFVVIAYAIASPIDWRATVTHEILHAQYFLEKGFRTTVDDFWENHVSDKDKQLIRAALGKDFNINDGSLVRNEFQAFILMPDSDKTRLKLFVPTYRQSLEAALTSNDVPPLRVAN